MFSEATQLLRGRLIAPYQRDGVRWMLDRETVPGIKGGFLCDEMGLGKTVQLITTMLGNPRNKTLIIVPKSIVNQWRNELKRFAPFLRVQLFDGPHRFLDPTVADVFIAPYSVILKLDTPLHRVRWDRIILDEGHEIRTRNTKRHVAIAALPADIRWVVSGTPVYNSMRDFVTLCTFLGLTKNYVQAETEKVRTMYVLRRTKDDVAKFNTRLALPPCDFANVEIEPYPEEVQLYREVFDVNQKRIKFLVSTATNIGMHHMELLECLLRVRQVMVMPQLYLNGIAKKGGTIPAVWRHPSKKMDTLFRLMHEHPTEKTLVFCQFIHEMKYIASQMTLPVFRIDGSVDKETRERNIAAFRAVNGGAVFLIQIKAGGQGLNLQEATRVYITAPSWNPATELQAIARAHRTGQTQKVVVRKLVCTGTPEYPSVEESIVGLQGHKSKVCADVLNDQRLAEQIPGTCREAVTLADVLNIFQV